MPSSNRLKYLDLQMRLTAAGVQFLHLKERASASRRLREMLQNLQIAATLLAPASLRASPNT